jgi:acetyl-CoA carboxylase alpha subunit
MKEMPLLAVRPATTKNFKEHAWLRRYFSTENPLRSSKEKLKSCYVQTESAVDISEEIDQLAKNKEEDHDIYSERRLQITNRHPERPYTLDYVRRVISPPLSSFTYDRYFSGRPQHQWWVVSFQRDRFVMVIGQQKVAHQHASAKL